MWTYRRNSIKAMRETCNGRLVELISSHASRRRKRNPSDEKWPGFPAKSTGDNKNNAFMVGRLRESSRNIVIVFERRNWKRIFGFLWEVKLAKAKGRKRRIPYDKESGASGISGWFKPVWNISGAIVLKWKVRKNSLDGYVPRWYITNPNKGDIGALVVLS